MNSSHPTILVTGGSGFVGRALLHELAGQDALFAPGELRIFDKAPLAADLHSLSLPLTFIEGDIRDQTAITKACENVDIVIHLASLVDWGTHPTETVFDHNVTGTRCVIDACRSCGVGVLVYTSSLDAIFTGKPIVDADESYPYPAKFVSTYGESKARAEQLVQAANSDSLKTAVLRPSGVFGEADPYHIPSLVKMARSGLFCKIGNGKSRCMHIYVGNVAHAHLLCAKALYTGNTAPAGQIYFLIDHPPENFFDTLTPIIERAGIRVRPKNLWLPRWLLTPVALIAEGTAFLLRPFVKLHPGVSRFALAYICNDFILKSDKATQDFGFTPKYTKEEAVARTAAWLKAHG